MKNYKLYFSILVIALLTTLWSCSEEHQNGSIGTVSLKFKNPSAETGRQNDSIILVDVVVVSASPLEVISDRVSVVRGVDEEGDSAEGVVLTDLAGKEAVRAGYLFNNATQCWVWGRWITNTATGQTDFQFGSASEQAYHNICAPSGSYYAKP